MTELAANLLLDRIQRASRWPIPFERKALARIARFAAFRESDEPTLRKMHKVNGEPWPDDRGYAIDPFANRISETYGDLLFGEDPTIAAAAVADQANIDRIAEASDLATELHWGEQINSSEGEVWWRVSSQPGVTEAPMITFHSREDLVPYFIGPIPVAAAFVSEFADPTDTSVVEGEPRRTYRHLEIQSAGRIENALYLGTRDTLGQRVDLSSFSETEDLIEVVDTSLPAMAAGRIINKRARDQRQGRSDYQHLEWILQALNEALTIGVENTRLVAKRRAVVPTSSIDQRAMTPELSDTGDGQLVPTGRARFDSGEDILTVDPLDAELGREGQGLFKVLEYSFDADQLVAWMNKLAKIAASRAGLTAQLIGEGDGNEGEAATGTALRVRLLPAIGSGKGRGRPWDREIPRALMLAQLLDSFSGGQGGYGRSYSQAGEPPAFERGDPLPRDETEETTRHVAAVAGEIEARETAIREMHPDWTDERVSDELDGIRSDSQDRARSMGFGQPPAPDDQPPPGPDDPPAQG